MGREIRGSSLEQYCIMLIYNNVCIDKHVSHYNSHIVLLFIYLFIIFCILGENINICWSPDGHTIAVGNKEDLVTFVDAWSQRIKTEEQFKFEVNEISWNNKNDLFFLTNGHGCINVLR